MHANQKVFNSKVIISAGLGTSFACWYSDVWHPTIVLIVFAVCTIGSILWEMGLNALRNK